MVWFCVKVVLKKLMVMCVGCCVLNFIGFWVGVFLSVIVIIVDLLVEVCFIFLIVLLEIVVVGVVC